VICLVIVPWLLVIMNKLIIILGPTASGKTDLAVKLAKRFNGEIVCADSRQIYSGMVIGTASPFQSQISNLKSQIYISNLKSNNQRKPIICKGTAHHLFNVIAPKKVFSAGQYQKLAIKTIKDIQKRGKLPILVGGSAFYIYPIIEGWQFPKLKANQKLRKELEQKTTKQLFAMLKKLSLLRAKTLDPKNKRRLIRAIEIAKHLGEVPKIAKKPIFDCLILGVKVSKTELAKRVEKRTAKMFRRGLEKEVKSLVKKYGWADVLKNTIGYQEFQTKESPSFLLKERRAFLISSHTLQLAKRQMTWFKKDKRIHWVKTVPQATNLIKKFTERIPL